MSADELRDAGLAAANRLAELDGAAYAAVKEGLRRDSIAAVLEGLE